MNKIKSVICLMVVICTMCFTGCGENKVVGTWIVESISAGENMTIKVEDAIGLFGVDSVEELLIFEMKSDNTAVGKAFGEESIGTWEEKNGVVTITMDGVSQEAKIEDDKLVMELEGNKMTLKKK